MNYINVVTGCQAYNCQIHLSGVIQELEASETSSSSGTDEADFEASHISQEMWYSMSYRIKQEVLLGHHDVICHAKNTLTNDTLPS